MDISTPRSSDLLCGRLVAMPSNTSQATLDRLFANTGLEKAVSINFPAMPDTIELARSTEYTVQNNMIAPDGIHVYKSTKSLEIPISFKLHAFDDSYCTQGAFTLLKLAGLLHSFTLPINTYGKQVQIAPVINDKPAATDPEGNPVQKGKPPDAQSQKDSSANSSEITEFSVAVLPGTKGGIAAPVTAWLHLMWVDFKMPGISCVGYVKEAKVVFSGPWMRGVHNSFNLPSSADYSFTFVHVPGYGNNKLISSTQQSNLSASVTSQAYADDVKDSFYNTQALVAAASYQGFATDQYQQ